MTPQGGSGADSSAPSVVMLAPAGSVRHPTYVDVVAHSGRGYGKIWNPKWKT